MSKRLKAFALALVVVATGIFAAPQAAFAQGGCTDNTPWNGWQIGSCISATGSTLKPDYYVNQKGSAPSGCEVRSYRVINGSSTLLDSRTCVSANVGHYGPFSAVVPTGPNLCYYHRVRVGPINGGYAYIISPSWCY